MCPVHEGTMCNLHEDGMYDSKAYVPVATVHLCPECLHLTSMCCIFTTMAQQNAAMS